MLLLLHVEAGLYVAYQLHFIHLESVMFKTKNVLQNVWQMRIDGAQRDTCGIVSKSLHSITVQPAVHRTRLYHPPT